jgi:hypothetical protein
MRFFIVRIEKGLNVYQHPVIEETFANHGKDVVPELSILLFSEDENIRRCGARLLCSINDLSVLLVVLDYLAVLVRGSVRI